MNYLFAVLSFLLLATTTFSAEVSSAVDVSAKDDVLQLGERMYREGILPSGEPMQAVVMGDIPVDGRMFTCDDCHQRSGLGSVEGTVITWPTNARDLKKPRRKTGAWRPPQSGSAKQNARKNLPSYWQVDDLRPAYTDESLAMLLWTGIDPSGRKLDPIMPLYNLEDSDMAIMVHYLNNLSAEIAPGVDATTIHFATVVTEGVSVEDRQTMLSTLQAHIDAQNSQSRHQENRAISGPFYKTEMYQAYRRWDLDVWDLKGPENTWPAQLQTYYQNQPVFALLGGLASGSWQPIHEFAEQNKIPTIFPLTDFPVISETDWYTLYFSKGYYQEGEAAARYLHIVENIDPEAKVVIVSRESRETKDLIQGFTENWHKYQRPVPELLEVAPGKKLTAQFWKQMINTSQPTFLILWLNSDDLEYIESVPRNEKQPVKIFLSSEMLEYSFADIPDILRDNVYLTYPLSMPGENKRGKLVVKSWLKARDIPVTDFEMQSRIYFLGWMLTGAVKHMRSEFFREYFLEGYDMMTDQDYAIAVYPRLTFGPGQRYASKGCYIVQLTKGANPELVKRSGWVIH